MGGSDLVYPVFVQQKQFCCSACRTKKQFSPLTHKEQPETALILERPTEMRRGKKEKNKPQKKPLEYLTSKKKKQVLK